MSEKFTSDPYAFIPEEVVGNDPRILEFQVPLAMNPEAQKFLASLALEGVEVE